MSSSEQQGSGQLTRKQLREIRLTGSTPVISEREAATAAAAAAAPVVPAAPVLPRAATPIEVAPAPEADENIDLEAAPLTRRQARAQERIRTASVPVITPEELAGAGAPDAFASAEPAESAESAEPAEPAPLVLESAEEEPVLDEPVIDLPADDDPIAGPVVDVRGDAADENVAVPLPTAPTFDAKPAVVSEVPRFDEPADEEEPAAPAPLGTTRDHVAVSDAGADLDADEDGGDDAVDDGDRVAVIDHAPLADSGQRLTVSSSFGRGVLGDDAPKSAFAPSFDELLTVNDSTGSQHIAPSALIFTQVPGESGLSGPVPSTGEILITGTYALPEGLGSQGHARGVADGKDVDAVLIDGELAPSSSPTPIAASAAVSTIKPAGEVIRPPAPEKGNKLMLTLAITAGGLALALAAALIFAFTTGVLG